MTREEVVTFLREAMDGKHGDPERAHVEAERRLLLYLGNDKELVDLWREASADWWYA